MVKERHRILNAQWIMELAMKRLVSLIENVFGFNLIPVLAVAGLFVLIYVFNLLFFQLDEQEILGIDAMPWLKEGQTAIELRQVLAMRDMSGRMLWGVTCIMQIIVFFASSGYFIYVITSSLTQRFGCSTMKSRLTQEVIVLLAFLMGVLFFLITEGSSSRRAVGLDFPAAFLTKALHLIHRVGLITAINVENGLTVFMITLGVFAISTIAVPSGAEVTGDCIKRRWYLSERIDKMRNLLNVSASALIAGVIQVHFEYRWVAGLLVNKKPDDVDKFWEPAITSASSITLAAGALFTFVLISAFVPALMILYRQVSDYNESVKDREQQCSRVSLEWKDYYWDAVKLIGPILTAGPLAALFKA